MTAEPRTKNRYEVPSTKHQVPIGPIFASIPPKTVPIIDAEISTTNQNPSLDMTRTFIQTLGACAVALSLTACGSSKPKITEPVGRVQLGMTVMEVSNVLGDGSIVSPASSDGAHTLEVREYPASNGRVYVVRYVDGLVRRWELQNR